MTMTHRCPSIPVRGVEPSPGSPPGPYGYECIDSPIDSVNFRVYDANDDRIATCYQAEHARLIVDLMNRGLKAILEAQTVTVAQSLKNI